MYYIYIIKGYLDETTIGDIADDISVIHMYVTAGLKKDVT